MNSGKKGFKGGSKGRKYNVSNLTASRQRINNTFNTSNKQSSPTKASTMIITKFSDDNIISLKDSQVSNLMQTEPDRKDNSKSKNKISKERKVPQARIIKNTFSSTNLNSINPNPNHNLNQVSTTNSIVNNNSRRIKISNTVKETSNSSFKVDDIKIDINSRIIIKHNTPTPISKSISNSTGKKHLFSTPKKY